MTGLNMKAFIVTNNCIYDENEKFLEPGKYYFLIKNFTNKKTIIGDIIDDNIKHSQYEFRFFTFMTMIIKAQSYLSRRLDKDKLSERIVSTIDITDTSVFGDSWKGNLINFYI